MQLPYHWTGSPLEVALFPDGTPIPVSKLVKDLRIQTDTVVSPSAQYTAVANKARRFVFMIRRSFQKFSKSACIPLYEVLVRPHLEYGMPACSLNLVTDINHLERIQRLATKLVTCIRHLTCEESYSSFVNIFMKRLEKVWTEVFPHLSH